MLGFRVQALWLGKHTVKDCFCIRVVRSRGYRIQAAALNLGSTPVRVQVPNNHVSLESHTAAQNTNYLVPNHPVLPWTLRAHRRTHCLPGWPILGDCYPHKNDKYS